MNEKFVADVSYLFNNNSNVTIIPKYKKKFEINNLQVRITSTWDDDEDIEVYNEKQHWNPKIFVENAFTDKLKEDLSYRVSRLDGKSTITEIRMARG